MVADLDYSQGFAAMAYVGDIPWHREGQKLGEDASFEQWLKASGMNWTIESAPQQWTDYNGNHHESPKRQVFYRGDNFAELSNMTNRYQVVQPQEVLSFIWEIAENFGAPMETAGCLAGGAKLWAMCRVGDMEIVGDQYRSYLHISTAIDGSLATTVDFTNVRIVCANTQKAALSDNSGNRVKVKHSTIFDPAIVREAIGMTDVKVATQLFAELQNNLAEIKVAPEQAQQFYANLLRPETTEKNKDRKIRGAEDLWLAYTSAPGAVPGTAYGLIQGLTYWLDHVRGSDTKRLESAWYGQGQKLKEQAVEQALQLAA